METKRTVNQNKQLYALLHQTGTLAHKEDLVYSYTRGRTTKSSEMDYVEAGRLIAYLKSKSGQPVYSDDRRYALRKALFAHGYQIGERPAFVKNWCEKMGSAGNKKSFNEYNSKELYALLQKFKKVVAHRITKVGAQIR